MDSPMLTERMVFSNDGCIILYAYRERKDDWHVLGVVSPLSLLNAINLAQQTEQTQCIPKVPWAGNKCKWGITTRTIRGSDHKTFLIIIHDIYSHDPNYLCSVSLKQIMRWLFEQSSIWLDEGFLYKPQKGEFLICKTDDSVLITELEMARAVDIICREIEDLDDSEEYSAVLISSSDMLNSKATLFVWEWRALKFLIQEIQKIKRR